MTSAIGRARKKFFAQDLDVQKYAAKDTVNDEYVAPAGQTEGERTDRHKVRFVPDFYPTPRLPLPCCANTTTISDSSPMPHAA